CAWVVAALRCSATSVPGVGSSSPAEARARPSCPAARTGNAPGRAPSRREPVARLQYEDVVGLRVEECAAITAKIEVADTGRIVGAALLPRSIERGARTPLPSQYRRAAQAAYVEVQVRNRAGIGLERIG